MVAESGVPIEDLQLHVDVRCNSKSLVTITHAASRSGERKQTVIENVRDHSAIEAGPTAGNWK